MLAYAAGALILSPVEIAWGGKHLIGSSTLPNHWETPALGVSSCSTTSRFQSHCTIS